jgi:hypothetical protein
VVEHSNIVWGYDKRSSLLLQKALNYALFSTLERKKWDFNYIQALKITKPPQTT